MKRYEVILDGFWLPVDTFETREKAQELVDKLIKNGCGKSLEIIETA